MKYLIFSLSLFSVTLLVSQETIKWYTWEEGMLKAEEESKKLFVDLYTDWCGWCKKMDKATFQNPMIAEYMNKHYIAIKFDAEQKTEIEFNGKVHKYVKRGRGYHNLAAELTNGKLSYPTIVFLDEDKKLIQAIPGFLDPPKFDPIMRYFAEDHHKRKPWVSYIAEYNKAQNPGKKKKDPNARLVKGN